MNPPKEEEEEEDEEMEEEEEKIEEEVCGMGEGTKNLGINHHSRIAGEKHKRPKETSFEWEIF